MQLVQVVSYVCWEEDDLNGRNLKMARSGTDVAGQERPHGVGSLLPAQDSTRTRAWEGSGLADAGRSSQ